MFKETSLSTQIAIWIVIGALLLIGGGFLVIPSMFIICISFAIIFSIEKAIWPETGYLPLLVIISSISIIALVAGFFGSFYLYPESNLAPLLGIFITGPIGAVVGGIVHLIYIIINRKK